MAQAMAESSDSDSISDLDDSDNSVLDKDFILSTLSDSDADVMCSEDEDMEIEQQNEPYTTFVLSTSTTSAKNIVWSEIEKTDVSLFPTLCNKEPVFNIPNDPQTPLYFFKLFVDDLMQIIVDETNRFAESILQSRLTNAELDALLFEEKVEDVGGIEDKHEEEHITHSDHDSNSEQEGSDDESSVTENNGSSENQAFFAQIQKIEFCSFAIGYPVLQRVHDRIILGEKGKCKSNYGSTSYKPFIVRMDVNDVTPHFPIVPVDLAAEGQLLFSFKSLSNCKWVWQFARRYFPYPRDIVALASEEMRKSVIWNNITMIYKFIVIPFLLIHILTVIKCHNKYSKEANVPEEDIPPPSLKTLKKPFRMAKLNSLWTKAQMRLSEAKLKSLFGELKLQDKEEVTWKKLKSEGRDKEGLKESELRKKLLHILELYGLLEHFEDMIPKKRSEHKMFNEVGDEHINKSLFKDKKLNKLWAKAEAAGFSYEELKTLREEFNHHQDKIDEYYSVLTEVKEESDSQSQDENSIDEKLERFNSINKEETIENDYLEKANLLREKHKDLRDGFDRLHRLSSRGPNSKEFVEPKVEGLWKIALDTDFSPEELESLRIELLHYENRLLKLRHLQAEVALNSDRRKEKEMLSGGKSDGVLLLEDNIKKTSRKVEKMHLNLEARIMKKHIEL
ncbi:hypothetical protein FQA39_LY15055 [Lamprigera yunnana]|nr:hypothetical protein FQA39_LY15055 [Lamprigera yunnana]